MFTKESFLTRHMEMKRDDGHVRAYQDFKENSLANIELTPLNLNLHHSNNDSLPELSPHGLEFHPSDGATLIQMSPRQEGGLRASLDDMGGQEQLSIDDQHYGGPMTWRDKQQQQQQQEEMTRQNMISVSNTSPSSNSFGSGRLSPDRNSITPPHSTNSSLHQQVYHNSESDNMPYKKFKGQQISPLPPTDSVGNGVSAQPHTSGLDANDNEDQRSTFNEPPHSPMGPFQRSLQDAQGYSLGHHNQHHNQSAMIAARMKVHSDSSIITHPALSPGGMMSSLTAHNGFQRSFEGQRLSQHDLDQVMGPLPSPHDMISHVMSPPAPPTPSQNHDVMSPPPLHELTSPNPHRNMVSSPPNRDIMSPKAPASKELTPVS